MFKRKAREFKSVNDEELMVLSSTGNRLAFDELYERYFSKLVWFANGILDDREAAKDIVQEVFIIIIEKPGKFDVTRKFSTWVYVVTSNLSKQHLRNKKNRERILNENKPQHTSVTTDQSIELKQFNQQIQQINKELSDKEKAIYELRFIQELGIREIAEILAIPEGSVKSGLFYLLKKYAHHLKEFKHE